MASKLIQKREELHAKQQALGRIFEAAGSDLDLDKVEVLAGFKDTSAKAAELKRLNDEMSVLGQECETLAGIEKMADESKAASKNFETQAGGMTHQTGSEKRQEQVKSLGELFVASKAYTGFGGSRGPVDTVHYDSFKTLLSTAAGWAPQSLRNPGFVESAQAIPTVLDVIPVGNTSQAAIVYMVESTYTNNAAERTEGANNAGEAALALTPTTATVRQIAVWIPVTKEQMDDVPYIQGYVNNRLSLMIRQRLSSEILSGNGVPPNLAGIIGMANVQVQPKGADPTPDAVYKAMTLVRVTGRAEPNATVWHPNDWQDVRLLRTMDGIYIWGSPSEAGPERIWGLRVIQDSGCTENTMIVGDFANFSELVMRSGIEFEVSDSHASLFIQYTLAIRAGLRAAFVVYRPAAFCTVTGI